MSCGIIIAAAGQGKRMGLGYNKQFITLHNKPILIHTIEKFKSIKWINQIILVVNPKEIEIVQDLLDEHELSVTHIVPGGQERQESIYNGLAYIDSDFVMVHDGARPFIRLEQLEALYKQVITYEAVVLGVPVKDTIKVTLDNGFIDYTPNRRSLWAIQTPQAFRLSLLKEAYEKAINDVYLGTDDASLVERLGVKVKVLEGDYHNIKITTPEDLAIAKMILKNGVR